MGVNIKIFSLLQRQGNSAIGQIQGQRAKKLTLHGAFLENPPRPAAS